MAELYKYYNISIPQYVSEEMRLYDPSHPLKKVCFTLYVC